MDIEQALLVLVEMMRHDPEIGHDDLVRALTDRGWERPAASRLVLFAPLALGRLLMAGWGVRTADHFRTPEGLTLRLATVPEFAAATTAGRRLASDELAVLALRSTELVQIKAAMRGGVRPTELTSAPMTIRY